MSMTMTWTTPAAYAAWSQRPPPEGWSGPWPPAPGTAPWPTGLRGGSAPRPCPPSYRAPQLQDNGLSLSGMERRYIIRQDLTNDRDRDRGERDRDHEGSRYPPSSSRPPPAGLNSSTDQNARPSRYDPTPRRARSDSSTEQNDRPSRYDPPEVGAYRPAAVRSASAAAAAGNTPPSSSRRASSREPRSTNERYHPNSGLSALSQSSREDSRLTVLLDAIEGAADKDAYYSQEGVDQLSNLLASFDSSDPSYPRGVKYLRRMCREAGLVPTSCILSKEVVRSSTEPSRSNFSDVWKASLDGHAVALKVLRLHGDERDHIKKTYLHELVVWQSLRHPNIVPFIGAPRLHEASLVSEWMSGGTVLAFLLTNPDHDRAELVADITAGVAFMHSLDVVHGDLKTENVLVDSQGRARLTDFGLATILIATATMATAGRGTIRYMAPELLDYEESNSAGRPTKKSDVYALAITIWRVYSEQVPFPESKSDIAVSRRVLKCERPPRTPEMNRRGMSDRLWTCITGWWGQDPSLRPLVRAALLSENHPSGHDSSPSLSNPDAPPLLSTAPNGPDRQSPNIPGNTVMHMHHILAYLPGVEQKWTWDVSCSPTTGIPARWAAPTPAHIHGTLGEAATNPSLPRIVLTCADLPYDVTVLPSMEGVPSSATPAVSVRDLIFALYKNLRMPLTHQEYGLLSSDRQRALATAYNTRLDRIADPTDRREEGSKGLKRIDYLIASGRTRFVGIVVTRKVTDIFTVNLI